jgi:hypothetical protein
MWGTVTRKTDAMLAASVGLRAHEPLSAAGNRPQVSQPLAQHCLADCDWPDEDPEQTKVCNPPTVPVRAPRKSSRAPLAISIGRTNLSLKNNTANPAAPTNSAEAVASCVLLYLAVPYSNEFNRAIDSAILRCICTNPAFRSAIAPESSDCTPENLACSASCS